MTNNTTTQPLYKRLNEQRTQGEWKHDIDRNKQEIFTSTFKGRSCIMSAETRHSFHVGTDQSEANAKYTALAVNNLHHLAEALEALTKWVTHNTDATPTALINAREALSRIS